MSDLADLIRDGFALVSDQAGNTLTLGSVSKTCIASPVVHGMDMQDAGFLPGAESTVEILATDLIAMGIAFGGGKWDLLDNAGKRFLVTLDTSPMRILSIEQEEADPYARVHLAADR